jgi:hypothetical protein
MIDAARIVSVSAAVLAIVLVLFALAKSFGVKND